MLGESKNVNLLHVARSFEKMRCPWFLSRLNETLALAPFPSGMVGRFPEAPISCSSRKARLSDGYGPCSTTSGPRLLMGRCPSSTVRNTALEVARFSITPGHLGTRRCQGKRTRTRGCWPPPVRCSTFCTECLGHEGEKWRVERDPGKSRKMASVDPTEACCVNYQRVIRESLAVGRPTVESDQMPSR